MSKTQMGTKAWALALVAVGALSIAGPSAAMAKKKAKPEGPVITVPASNSLAPSGTATALAACPPGTGVVGGGFSSQPTPGTDPGAMVIESRAAGNAWLATAVENSSSPGIVSTEAYCRKNAPALTVVTGVAPLQAATASAYGTGTATAECPAGYSAVAGGFAGPFEHRRRGIGQEHIAAPFGQLLDFDPPRGRGSFPNCRAAAWWGGTEGAVSDHPPSR